MSNTYCCIDISNILYKTYHVNISALPEDLVSMAFHSSLLTLNKYYKQYKPTKAVFVYDRNNWRLEYTKSDICYTDKEYKGHRRQNMSPKERDNYIIFKKFVKEFEDMIREHTKIPCLAADGLEADDLIAGMVQVYGDADNIVIVSADKDLTQLLRCPNVKLVEPTTNKERTLEPWDNNADYFIFEKCLRGDAGDNVMSAYPRVRSTRIKKAFYDPFERVNLLKETWTDHNKKLHVVEDVFEENVLLMDLYQQPECVQRKILEVIEYEMNRTDKKYSHFHFIKFLGKYGLKNISKNLEQFVPLLAR